MRNFCQFRSNKFTLESDRSYSNSAAKIVLRIFKFHTLFYLLLGILFIYFGYSNLLKVITYRTIEVGEFTYPVIGLCYVRLCGIIKLITIFIYMSVKKQRSSFRSTVLIKVFQNYLMKLYKSLQRIVDFMISMTSPFTTKMNR